MAAQILPLIDTASQGIEMERMMRQQEYQNQLNNIREAKLSNEEALAPLRQQVMQSELDRNKQALQESAQRMTQGGIAAKQDYQSKVLEQQLQGLNITHAQQTVDQTATEIADEQKNHWKDKLQQSVLDERTNQEAEHLGTFLASIPVLYRDPVERQNAIQPLVDKGIIDQTRAQKILSVPFTSKQQSELATQLDSALGDGSGSQFEALDKEASILKQDPKALLMNYSEDQVSSAKTALKEQFAMLERMRTIRQKQQEQKDATTKQKTGGAPIPLGGTLNDDGSMSFMGFTWKSNPVTQSWQKVK